MRLFTYVYYHCHRFCRSKQMVLITINYQETNILSRARWPSSRPTRKIPLTLPKQPTLPTHRNETASGCPLLDPTYHALFTSHLISVMLTSCPVFSSQSNHSLSPKSIPVNFVPVSSPVASQSPSGLKFTNSHPRHSIVRIFACFGGDDMVYGVGPDFIVAEDSR